MRNTLRQATTLWLALAILTPLGVQAKTRDALRSDVIEWAGTGEAEAYVVVDFDQITTLSREFVFGVRFTTGTTITGQTALDMLTSETAFSHVAPGGFLDSMSYDYKGTVHTRGGPYPKWWTYWGSNDYGTSWTAHSVGIDSRVMADGDTDGWMHFRDGFPVTAVPNGPRTTPRVALEEDVIEWAGTGEAEAYVVVDFDQSSTVSREFVFGVRFTTGTTVTSQQAMDLLTSETAFSYVAPGGFLDSISYEYKGTVYSKGGPYPEWWSYWGSSDCGTSWTAHSVGIDSRVMADGDTDGWMHFRDGWPVTAVPNGPRTTPRVALEEDVIEWVGTGPYTAYVVVDFSQSATSWAEFVFATRFTSPTLTGRQLLDLVVDNTALSYDAPGGFMSEMTYQNGPLYYSGGGAYPHWWSYWLLDVAAPEAMWTSSMVGFEGRVVEDGTVDGWAFDLDGWPAVAPNGPRQDLIPNAARHWSLYR